jgi:hypothetical protein
MFKQLVGCAFLAVAIGLISPVVFSGASLTPAGVIFFMVLALSGLSGICSR